MKMKTIMISGFWAAVFTVTLAGLSFSGDSSSKNSAQKAGAGAPITIENLDQMTRFQGDIGPLPAVPIPATNPQTREKIELGKMLFFDKRLSGDKTISCATCHDPRKGFADGRALAKGFKGKKLGRHSPTVINTAYNGLQFWDGRAGSLEEQAMGPIEAPGEMNLPGNIMSSRLVEIPEYKQLFWKVFGENPSLENVGKAIAAFERTIVTSDSPFDRYAKGDKNALNGQEKKGLVLFMSKAACTQCHNGPNFNDNKFHVLGVPQKGPLQEDLGRYEVTKKEEDRGAFKTPTLRNISQTAPYMHDGALKTLEEVVDFYNDGGGQHPNKSPKILKLRLTKGEKQDLTAFLKTLNGKLPKISEPRIP